MFTTRQLWIIQALAANEAEDVSALHQQQLEREDITDADVLSYVEELRGIARRAEYLRSTEAEESPIAAFDPNEAEELPLPENPAAIEEEIAMHEE